MNVATSEYFPELGSITPYVRLPVLLTLSSVKIPDVTRAGDGEGGAVLLFRTVVLPLGAVALPFGAEEGFPPDEHADATRIVAAETVRTTDDDHRNLVATFLSAGSLSDAF